MPALYGPSACRGVQATLCYDRPPPHFRPTALRDAHELLVRLRPTLAAPLHPHDCVTAMYQAPEDGQEVGCLSCSVQISACGMIGAYAGRTFQHPGSGFVCTLCSECSRCSHALPHVAAGSDCIVGCQHHPLLSVCGRFGLVFCRRRR